MRLNRGHPSDHQRLWPIKQWYGHLAILAANAAFAVAYRSFSSATGIAY
jgi:hypothetical protein